MPQVTFHQIGPATVRPCDWGQAICYLPGPPFPEYPMQTVKGGYQRAMCMDDPSMWQMPLVNGHHHCHHLCQHQYPCCRALGTQCGPGQFQSVLLEYCAKSPPAHILQVRGQGGHTGKQSQSWYPVGRGEMEPGSEWDVTGMGFWGHQLQWKCLIPLEHCS